MDFCFDNHSVSTKKHPAEIESRRKFIQKTILAAGGLVLASSGLLSCSKNMPRTRRPIRTKYNTIAHKMLDVELVHIFSQASYQALDEILAIAEHLLEDESAGKQSAYAFAVHELQTTDQILKFYGFEYQKNSLLATALASRKIDCDGYSAIYLAIGEVLNLPIKMVRAPAHTFVRWELRNGTYLNWETTIGAVKSDAYYISKHKIAKGARGKSALRSLDIDDNRDEVLANSYVNCGVEWLKKLQYQKALAFFDKAIQGDPLYEAPYFNKGLVYFHMGDMNRAVQWCEKAVRLNPNHMKSHAVLGTAYKELNKSRKAKLHFRKVRELDPEYYAVKIMELEISGIERQPLSNVM